MRPSIPGVLLFSCALFGVAVSPTTAATVVLESGEFTLTYFVRWTANPTGPTLNGADWAQFYVDSGLDTMMSNGQLVSEAFLANFNGYNPAFFALDPNLNRARINPSIDNTDVNVAALEAALNLNAAALGDLKLELIETTAGGQLNVPLVRHLADFSYFVFDYGTGIVPQMWWDWDNDDSFIEGDSTYRFRITAECRCMAGTVNAANGIVTNVLFINGSSGGADRTVEISKGDFLIVTLKKPIAGGSGRFVLHANAGTPSDSVGTDLPFDVGTTCFPFLLQDGASPVIIATNIGYAHLVGVSQYFGIPAVDPGPATTTFFYPELPLGTVLTFQAIITDLGSMSPRNASVTNTVILRVLP